LNKALVNRLADLLAASSVAFGRYLSVNVGAGSARAKARNRYHRRAWKGLLRVVVYTTRLLRKVTWSDTECARGLVWRR